MNLHRRHKTNRRNIPIKSRTNRPEIRIKVFRKETGGHAEFVPTGGYKVVHCLLYEQNKDGRRQMMRFCHTHGLYVTFTGDGWADVTGNEADLLLLDVTRFWANPLIREWHWKENVHVTGGAGAGENPKRVKMPRFTPTSKEGVVDLKEMAELDRAMNEPDENTAEREKYGKPVPHLQGDETLDKLDMARRRKAEEDWKRMGLSQPSTSVGPTGKVL